jgi:hypothetical protein
MNGPVASTLVLLADLHTPLAAHIMSGWGLGWFGGGAQKKEAPKKAILQLRGQLEMLNKREKHLQNQMDEQDSLARKHVSNNKTGMLPTPVLSTE